MSRQRISTTLRKASSILRRRGWTRGVIEDTKGAVCASRALELAGGERGAAHFFLRKEVLLGQWVSLFNDQECESPDDVLALFEIGADIAECNERAAIQGEV